MESLELRNVGVDIAVKTANFRCGPGLYGPVRDPGGDGVLPLRWKSANPDRELLAALRPALASVPESLTDRDLARRTSRAGVLFDMWRDPLTARRMGGLIWKAPTTGDEPDDRQGA
ncbi:MAG: hypothetical protein M0C28_02955 [Candidatus Moduliflexus flocculans]|nr:hypothetical protein [Candidatus Moduliflexus flocculans]